jgi:secondary thiamine-phosphate synthase enzyme
MKIQHDEIVVNTSASTDIVDITEEARKFADATGIESGLFVAAVPGSTASITTIEYESGVLEDLKRAVEELVPGKRKYAHDARWGDGNGYSHVRAALLKPSLTVPVIDGKINLGTWQQLVLLDFDNKPRKRKITFSIIGTS